MVRRDTYLYDALWSMMTDFKFHKNVGTDKKPKYEATYKRWHELDKKGKSSKRFIPDDYDVQDVADMFKGIGKLALKS